jgi:phospho-N-acetylmuramoyl-pentapeptide-transferase
MFYHLFAYLDKVYDFPGAGVFQYISFRAGAAFMVSLIISLIFGKSLIRLLQRKQVGETVRDLGLQGQKEKEGTPTMGGLIIIAGILIPSLLFAKLDNVYIQLMIITTILLGFIGFMDDYIKVFRKNKKGLAGKFKIIGQILVGIIIGYSIYSSGDIVIREKIVTPVTSLQGESVKSEYQDVKSFKTTIPFLKHNELDYSELLSFLGETGKKYSFILFIVIVIFIITAVSNGANLTDGIDGLAAGTSAIIGGTLAIFAWISGNIIFADYLNIMYLPGIGELTIFISAFIGALIGFLWFNTFPAQVFMGDTGSLTIGGIIAVFAILIRKELLLPILAGIFLAESLSVMMQVSYFKYTKKKWGEGRRIFRMSPLHHHFQKLNYKEPKIVMRFYIVGIMLAILAFITLKLR